MRTTGKATDLITFSRSSGGTALRKIGYGSELVTNGTFDTDSDWILSNGYSISGGSLLYDGTAALYRKAYQSLSTQAGKLYKLTFTLSGLSGSSVAFGLSQTNSEPFLSYGLYDEDGTYTLYVVADGTSCRVQIQNNLATQTFSVDNISVKEVLFDQGDLTLFNHPADIPRIEYDANGNVLGLLVEEPRTNLLTYSEDFSNAAWIKSNSSIVANAVVSPDGALTGDKIVENTNNSAHVAYQAVSLTSGATYTYTVHAKLGERTAIYLGFGGIINADALFNLNTGTVISEGTALDSSSITPVGNGWYRCAITHTATATATRNLQILPVNESNAASYTGDGVSGIYIWGAQLEAGAFPTSYIPTSGSTATRAADVASIATSEFGYRDDEGTVVVEASMANPSSNPYQRHSLSINDGTGNNQVRFYNYNSNSGSFVVTSSAATQAAFVSGVTNEDLVKSGGVYKVDDFAASFDGGSATNDTSGVLSANALTKMDIGSTNSSGFLSGHIKSIKYIPRRLTNDQLQEITS